MSQSPHRNDPSLDLEIASLDLEVASAEELERVLITVTVVEVQQREDAVPPPPPNRRCDSAHREILRQPFLLDR